MPAITPVVPNRFPNHYCTPAQLPNEADDQPPSSKFVRDFFAGHKNKIFWTGVAAILAGMALIVADLFSAGVVLPFTAHLTIALFGFGATALMVGVTTKLLTEDLPVLDDTDTGKIKPRGKRCSRRYFE